MPRKPRETRVGLSDDELGQVLALAGRADSGELKLTVPDEHHRSTIIALGMDPLDSQIRMVSFFDTPDPALSTHGPRRPRTPRTRREDDSVVKLRPVFVLKLNFKSADLGRKLVAEMWLYPDGSRILELSTQCAPAQMFRVVAESRAFLTGRGVDPSGEQQTKTAAALSYFVAQPPGSAP